MSEYRLSKVNKKNELERVENNHELMNISDQETKLMPKEKNELAKLTNTGKEICVNASREIVKITGTALVGIRNKLAKINWSNVGLTILKSLLFTTTETKVYTEYKTVKVVKKTSSQNYSKENKESPKSDVKIISVGKNKQIETKKQKVLENKKSKQVETKDKNLLMQKPLLIENKKNND